MSPNLLTSERLGISLYVYNAVKTKINYGSKNGDLGDG